MVPGLSVGETIEERVGPKRYPVREVPPSEIGDFGHSVLRLAENPSNVLQVMPFSATSRRPLF